MANQDSLEKLLRAKQQQQQATHASLDTRKIDYQQRIRKLYENVRHWLTPLKEAGLVSFDDKRQIELTEEFIGTYRIAQLDIRMAADCVSLIPRGTLIIGSFGRVDMKASTGRETFLILTTPGSRDDWEFVQAGPHRHTWALTETSFKEELQRLIS